MSKPSSSPLEQEEREIGLSRSHTALISSVHRPDMLHYMIPSPTPSRYSSQERHSILSQALMNLQGSSYSPIPSPRLQRASSISIGPEQHFPTSSMSFLAAPARMLSPESPYHSGSISTSEYQPNATRNALMWAQNIRDRANSPVNSAGSSGKGGYAQQTYSSSMRSSTDLISLELSHAKASADLENSYLNESSVPLETDYAFAAHNTKGYAPTLCTCFCHQSKFGGRKCSCSRSPLDPDDDPQSCNYDCCCCVCACDMCNPPDLPICPGCKGVSDYNFSKYDPEFPMRTNVRPAKMWTEDTVYRKNRPSIPPSQTRERQAQEKGVKVGVEPSCIPALTISQMPIHSRECIAETYEQQTCGLPAKGFSSNILSQKVSGSPKVNATPIENFSSSGSKKPQEEVEMKAREFLNRVHSSKLLPNEKSEEETLANKEVQSTQLKSTEVTSSAIVQDGEETDNDYTHAKQVLDQSVEMNNVLVKDAKEMVNLDHQSKEKSSEDIKIKGDSLQNSRTPSPSLQNAKHMHNHAVQHKVQSLDTDSGTSSSSLLSDHETYTQRSHSLNTHTNERTRVSSITHMQYAAKPLNGSSSKMKLVRASKSNHGGLEVDLRDQFISRELSIRPKPVNRQQEKQIAHKVGTFGTSKKGSVPGITRTGPPKKLNPISKLGWVDALQIQSDKEKVTVSKKKTGKLQATSKTPKESEMSLHSLVSAAVSKASTSASQVAAFGYGVGPIPQTRPDFIAATSTTPFQGENFLPTHSTPAVSRVMQSSGLDPLQSTPVYPPPTLDPRTFSGEHHRIGLSGYEPTVHVDGLAAETATSLHLSRITPSSTSAVGGKLSYVEALGTSLPPGSPGLMHRSSQDVIKPLKEGNMSVQLFSGQGAELKRQIDELSEALMLLATTPHPYPIEKGDLVRRAILQAQSQARSHIQHDGAELVGNYQPNPFQAYAPSLQPYQVQTTNLNRIDANSLQPQKLSELIVNHAPVNVQTTFPAAQNQQGGQILHELVPELSQHPGLVVSSALLALQPYLSQAIQAPLAVTQPSSAILHNRVISEDRLGLPSKPTLSNARKLMSSARDLSSKRVESSLSNVTRLAGEASSRIVRKPNAWIELALEKCIGDPTVGQQSGPDNFQRTPTTLEIQQSIQPIEHYTLVRLERLHAEVVEEWRRLFPGTNCPIQRPNLDQLRAAAQKVYNSAHVRQARSQQDGAVLSAAAKDTLQNLFDVVQGNPFANTKPMNELNKQRGDEKLTSRPLSVQKKAQTTPKLLAKKPMSKEVSTSKSSASNGSAASTEGKQESDAGAQLRKQEPEETLKAKAEADKSTIDTSLKASTSDNISQQKSITLTQDELQQLIQQSVAKVASLALVSSLSKENMKVQGQPETSPHQFMHFDPPPPAPAQIVPAAPRPHYYGQHQNSGVTHNAERIQPMTGSPALNTPQPSLGPPQQLLGPFQPSLGSSQSSLGPSQVSLESAQPLHVKPLPSEVLQFPQRLQLTLGEAQHAIGSGSEQSSSLGLVQPSQGPSLGAPHALLDSSHLSLGQAQPSLTSWQPLPGAAQSSHGPMQTSLGMSQPTYEDHQLSSGMTQSSQGPPQPTLGTSQSTSTQTQPTSVSASLPRIGEQQLFHTVTYPSPGQAQHSLVTPQSSSGFSQHSLGPSHPHPSLGPSQSLLGPLQPSPGLMQLSRESSPQAFVASQPSTLTSQPLLESSQQSHVAQQPLSGLPPPSLVAIQTQASVKQFSSGHIANPYTSTKQTQPTVQTSIPIVANSSSQNASQYEKISPVTSSPVTSPGSGLPMLPSAEKRDLTASVSGESGHPHSYTAGYPSSAHLVGYSTPKHNSPRSPHSPRTPRSPLSPSWALAKLSLIPPVPCSYHFDSSKGRVTMIAYQDTTTGKQSPLFLNETEQAAVTAFYRQITASQGGNAPQFLSGASLANLTVGTGLGDNLLVPQIQSIQAIPSSNNTQVQKVAFWLDGKLNLLDLPAFEKKYPNMLSAWQMNQRQLAQPQNY